MAEEKCCGRCGYLSVREVMTGELHEATAEFRDQGSLPTKGSGEAIFRAKPVCFVMAAPLSKLVSEKSEVPLHQRMKQPIDCGRFIEWIQGYSPKEHHQMLREEAIERLRQEQAEAERKRHDEKIKSDRVSIIIGAAIGAAATALAAILGYLAHK